MSIVTIVGDSLSMVRPQAGFLYSNTYPYQLQLLLGPQYHVVLRSRRKNNVAIQSIPRLLADDILYNASDHIVLHLGIVDCAPRLFSVAEQGILQIVETTRGVKHVAQAIIRFKSKHRRFFTQHFPKTYVSQAEFYERYNFIIQEIRQKARPRRVLIVNIIDTNERNKLRSYDFEGHIIAYNKIIESLVTTNSDICRLIDLFSITKQRSDLFMEDGIHLSARGHECLAKLLCREIQKEA